MFWGVLRLAAWRAAAGLSPSSRPADDPSRQSQADHPQLVSDILDIVGNSVTVAPIELPEATAGGAAAAATADAAAAAATADAAAAATGPVIYHQASYGAPTVVGSRERERARKWIRLGSCGD